MVRLKKDTDGHLTPKIVLKRKAEIQETFLNAVLVDHWDRLCLQVDMCLKNFDCGGRGTFRKKVTNFIFDLLFLPIIYFNHSKSTTVRNMRKQFTKIYVV